MQILAPTKPGALGLSDHSLGLSCARPVLARADPELAFERPGEIREIVEADGVGDFPVITRQVDLEKTRITRRARGIA